MHPVQSTRDNSASLPAKPAAAPLPTILTVLGLGNVVLGYVNGTPEHGYTAWREIVPSRRHRHMRRQELGHSTDLAKAVAYVQTAPRHDVASASSAEAEPAVGSIWFLSGPEKAAGKASGGTLSGFRLAEYLHVNGRLEPEEDYVPVQALAYDGVQYTLGITSKGTFRWFDDIGQLGDMAFVSASMAENERTFREAVHRVAATSAQAAPVA